MKGIIEGFLKFHSDAYPKRADLFKNLATKQNPRRRAYRACQL